MGSCFHSTLLTRYNQYFQELTIGQLTDMWTTLDVYKIRQIYRKYLRENETQLIFESFQEMIPGLKLYEPSQRKKIFSIFDKDQKNALSFSNLLNGLSICKFGSQKILCVIIFMLYDDLMVKHLTKDQLRRLMEQNKQFIVVNQNSNSEDIYNQLMNGKQILKIEQFLEKALKIINFTEYRLVFSVFGQQRIQKQLALQFNQLNNIYNQDQSRYIAYLISSKWFQSWKYYILQHFKIDITNNLSKSKVKVNTNLLNNIDQARNLDYVHANVGQKPREINNSFLEGQFQNTLKPNLQHQEYVLVSQKVWQKLFNIYGGGPSFRRTGNKQLQMYPKLLKIYSGLFHGKINYSSEVIRQVPNQLTTYEIFNESLDISKQQLTNYTIYLKVIGVENWMKIQDLNISLEELHNSNLFFILYLKNQQQVEQFMKIDEKIHLGDCALFVSQQISKQVIYLGMNTEGKYIFHYSGQDYSNDFCLTQNQYETKIKILKNSSITKSNIIKMKNDSSYEGCLLKLLLNIPQFSLALTKITNKDEKNILTQFNLNRSQKNENLKNIRNFRDALNKKIPLSDNEIDKLPEKIIEQIHKQYIQIKETDIITEKFCIQQNSIENCHKCNDTNVVFNSYYTLNLEIPQDYEYYSIVLVPYVQNLQKKTIKRYGFLLPVNANFVDYKQKFKQVANLKHKIYKNDIIRNYTNVKSNQTLNNIGLKPNDQIFAYQIIVDFSDFVKKHYTAVQEDMIEPKINMFVDCNNEERGWMFGKICSIEQLTYTRRTVVNVLHKVNRDEEWKINYDNFQLSSFPTRSYQKSQQFLIRINQRRFNQSRNNMEKIGLPMIITLTEWMRRRQLFFQIYLQMRRFISEQFQSMNDQDWKQMKLKSEKNLKKSKKLEKKKTQQFKNYFNSQNFPYKLNLVDLDGRCSICFRFVKSVIYKGQSDQYCLGCQLSEADPISWQVKCTDIIICVDWKYSENRKEQIIIEDQSYKSMIKSKENSKIELKQCIENWKRIQNEKKCRCGQKLQIKQQIIKQPQILMISVKRSKNEKGYIKNINKILSYQIENFKFNKNNYILRSVLASTTNFNHFSYFIKQNKNWNQYNSQSIKTVTTNTLLNNNAHFLIYIKV